jgi:multiple sugar transport system substrate-binding protein
MSMRAFLRTGRWVLGASLAACVAFTSCGPAERKAGAPADRVELTYWPAPNQQEVQLADTLVRLWNRLHPDIHVTMQPIPVSQSTEEVLLAAIAGRTTPDICSNIWPGALYEFMQAGGLVPLDGLPGFDSVVTSRTPAPLLESFRSGDGRYYQVPWKTNPVMMFSNLDLFSAAGVDAPPRTYGEFLAAGARVTRDVDGDGRTDIWMGERDIRPIWWQRWFDFYAFFIAASGGQTLFRGGRTAFDSPAGAEVMGFFQQCYGRGYFPRTFYQGGDPFLLGRKATHFAGPWQIAALQRYAPTLRYAVTPLPVPDGHSGPVYTYGDYKNIAIFSTTRHPKEAWAFVCFLLSAEHDLLLLQICNQIPARGDLLSNPLFATYFHENPAMLHFAAQAPWTRGMDAVPDLKEIFDAISLAYERSAVYGVEAPATAIDDAAQRVRTIIEWNR